MLQMQRTPIKYQKRCYIKNNPNPTQDWYDVVFTDCGKFHLHLLNVTFFCHFYSTHTSCIWAKIIVELNRARNKIKDLRGWISKDFDIETPMKKLKNEFMCLCKGKPLGEMGFTKKMWFWMNPSAVGGWC